MTIIDSSINVYNYNLMNFIFCAGCIAGLIGFVVTFVMLWGTFENTVENVIPVASGVILFLLFSAFGISLADSNKNITCYRVVLEPGFTEDEFNAITTGFVIGSYENGFWYLEELNPNNEVQKPNTEQERHRFYLIYSGDKGEVEKLTFVSKAPK